jgi:hypothetical protein
VHERLEDVGDAGARTLDREEVVAAGRRIARKELGHEMTAHQLLCVREHPDRQRVVIAEDSVHPFTDKEIRLERVRVACVFDAPFEERIARSAGTFRQKSLQAQRDAALLRQTAEIRAQRDPSCLGHGKLAQTEIRRTRLESDPVRVAAPRIEHQALAPVFGEFDQSVLELERAQAQATQQFGPLHCAPFVRPPRILAWRVAAQRKSLPAAR